MSAARVKEKEKALVTEASVEEALLPGERVQVGISPDDLSRAQITYHLP